MRTEAGNASTAPVKKAQRHPNGTAIPATMRPDAIAMIGGAVCFRPNARP
ncbi:unannotated protein [freshwater metagenome]|uniref:Unannotated protein n=1 Tax=freshwater metagenome TaxID=449393 RepID=A0A6J7R629_9ZZZZ